MTSCGDFYAVSSISISCGCRTSACGVPMTTRYLLLRQSEGRVLLTHDVSTSIGQAYEHVRLGENMTGVIAVAQSVPVAVAIEDLVLVAECSSSEEWRDQVRHIPLR
jgi:hypothetical protein